MPGLYTEQELRSQESPSLMSLLLNRPSLAERIMSLQSMGILPTPQRASLGTTGPGTAVPTSGATPYAYTTWDKPYWGTPPGMVSRQGITLQPGAMQSLVDIARQSKLMPGIKEIGMIGGGYRPPSAQHGGAGIFADPGMSYHGQGLAIDALAWTQNPTLARLLAQYGWNQFSPSGDAPHWSYGVTG